MRRRWPATCENAFEMIADEIPDGQREAFDKVGQRPHGRRRTFTLPSHPNSTRHCLHARARAQHFIAFHPLLASIHRLPPEFRLTHRRDSCQSFQNHSPPHSYADCTSSNAVFRFNGLTMAWNAALVLPLALVRAMPWLLNDNVAASFMMSQ